MNATIDETIGRVEQLYTTLTGQQPPQINGGAPIPARAEPLVHVEEQLARMLATLEQVVTSTRQASTWIPRAVGWRDEAGLALAIDLPGVVREHLAIQLERGKLVVSGIRRPPWTAARSARVDGCDVALGTFSRSFELPAQVAADHISARLDRGVLTIRVTGGVRGEPSEIPIKS